MVHVSPRGRVASWSHPEPDERDRARLMRDYLRWRFPGAIVHKVANETAIPKGWSPEKRRNYLLARARDGVITGFPDLLVLPRGGAAFLVEAKDIDGRLSDAQRDLHPMIRANGYPVLVATDHITLEQELRAAGRLR